jgi:hypothetical protein
VSGFLRWADREMTSDQVAAQFVHLPLAGWPLTVVGLVCHGWGRMLVATGIVLVLAGLKEFVYDVNASWGEGDSWGDSVIDFMTYCVGAAFAWGLVLVLVRFHLACR